MSEGKVNLPSFFFEGINISPSLFLQLRIKFVPSLQG